MVMSMIYDKNVIGLVVEIFRKDSEIYKALMNGDKISPLVKKSFSKKGFGVTRIKDKKKLFNMCKEQECACEKNVSVDANI